MLSPGTPPRHPPLFFSFTPTCDGRLPLIVVWWPRPDALPLGKRYHPLLCHRQRPSIRPYYSRSCWPGTRGGRLESCCIWGIARSNIRATGDGENGGDGARTRTGTNDRPLLYDCPTPHSEQHRQGKEHAISGHLGSLCWARSLPRIAIGFPLSGPAITASACCGLGHWRPSPLARMPSLSRPIFMQDTHPRAVLQSRGGSLPLDHGPWKCGQCLVSSPGVCAAFPYYSPRWLLRIPSVYMDSSLLSPVTEALFSLVISFEKLQVRQTDRKRSSSHPPSTTQTGR